MSDIQSPADVSVLAGYKGLLTIGDPCLGTRRRVGRVDDTWASSFKKLSQALDIARERQLLPIITGDLLHESRDIGQLLPIINLFKANQVLLMPRKSRWEDRQEGHIAAILSAANIARVVGHHATCYKINIQEGQKIKTMELECHTSWGGANILDMGTPAYIQIKNMDMTIAQSSSLPTLDSDEKGGAMISTGRLIRLSHAEEAMEIAVTAITPEGFERIPLDIMPVVFSDSSLSAEQTQSILTRDSQFVTKLREAAVDSLEEDGKESLVSLCDDVCDKLKRDDWIRSKMLNLAKMAGVEG